MFSEVSYTLWLYSFLRHGALCAFCPLLSLLDSTHLWLAFVLLVYVDDPIEITHG